MPVSSQYGDPYYARADGLSESIYTFLGGCDLPARWANRPHYTIAETGFGTGLNFLATLRAFTDDTAAPARLTFISVEGHPLKAEDVRQAHAAFPDIAAESEALLAILPPPEAGIHRRTMLEGRVELILLYGQANAMLPRLTTHIDAWYLDGFAPARNPDLWSEATLGHIARTSRKGTKLATFTAAGFVRRGLAALGFDVQKAPGFGHKRERLIAEYKAGPPANRSTAQPVTIIGAGIAGLTLGQRLQQMGRNVRILATAPDDTSHTVPLPIIMPRLQLARDQAGPNFIALAYARAVQSECYGQHIIGDTGGLMRAGGTADSTRLKRIAEVFDWGSDWVTTVKEGLFFPKSLALDSHALLAKLRGQLDIQPADIKSITQVDGGWQLVATAGQHINISGDLVLATGAGQLPDGAPSLPLRPVPGHVAWFDAHLFEGLPDYTHVGDRYITPIDPARGSRLIGATTEQHKPAEDPAAELLAASDEFHQITVDTEAADIWYGVRATTPDHLPLVGPWPKDVNAAIAAYNSGAAYAEEAGGNRLWLFTGFGSKGFQYAAHATDILAEQMNPQPRLEEARTQRALAPIRFAARDKKRGLS